ncbi:MAG: methyltransferase [Candidatus Babeliales bacterium]
MNIDIFSLLNNIMLARALFVAAEINIAEHLSKKAMDISELAAATNTEQSSLKRLLNLLALHDVFFKDTNGMYHTTDFSSTMCADHPQTIKPFLLHDDETRWNSFGHLGYSIKTGKAAFDMLYNESYFDYLKKHPVLSARFDEAMVIISQEEDATIAAQLSFYGTVADIGGGKGQLITKIMLHNPSVNGIVCDLPDVVANIENFPGKEIAGNFFEPLPFSADIFILKRIIHDWHNEKALQILKNVSAAMKADSKLYIIDGILDHAHNKKLLAAIDLALLTIFQGQERTLSEFTELIQSAGLEIVNIITINDTISSLECKKI